MSFPVKKRGYRRVVSWNVNGIRACVRKGWRDIYNASEAHIFSMQEVRALPEQIPDEVTQTFKAQRHFFPAERKGYSGVGSVVQKVKADMKPLLLKDVFDCEGRLEQIDVDGVRFVNGYFPNGSGKNRDNSRVPYKLAFYTELLQVCQRWEAAGLPVVIYGDWNTAHKDIDLARPKGNRKTSGFLPEECAALDVWTDAGYIDLFRATHGDLEGQYTWWSNRPGVRERNVGWRIDMFMGNRHFIEGYRFQANHVPTAMGSDHCPIVLDYRKK